MFGLRFRTTYHYRTQFRLLSSYRKMSSTRYTTTSKELAIVSAASSIGGYGPGTELFPRYFHEPLLSLLRNRIGYKLYGDVGPNDGLPLHKPDSNHRSIGEKRKELSDITWDISERVCSHVASGRSVLTLGGDHSIAIGSVSGVAKAVHQKYAGQKKLGIIWIDAHADINTPETSKSGNYHGMPLAFLSGLARENATRPFCWIEDKHYISLDKLVYIGLRSIDDFERKVIEKYGIKVFTPFDVTHLDIREVMDQILAYLGRDTPIHLGFDIDGLDPSVAPCTGMPVPGGITLREGLYIAERLHRSGQMFSMDLVEFNPGLGTPTESTTTSTTAMSIVERAFAGSVV